MLVLSDGGPITIREISHDDASTRIRTWQETLTALPGGHDLYATAQAALTLIETDAATGISLEDFEPVGGLVSRVIAYAYGLDPRYTTVYRTVA